MQVFPDTIPPDEGYREWSEHLTDLSDGYKAGVAYANLGREYGLLHAVLTFSDIEIDDLEELHAFFEARLGRYEPFAFYSFRGHDSSPIGKRWPRLMVGVHDSSTTTWDLPIKSSSSRVLTVAGVTKTAGVDFTFAAGAGAEGCDRVTGLAGSAGDLILLDAVGRRKARAAFVEQSMPFDLFAANLAKTGLEIIERPLVV